MKRPSLVASVFVLFISSILPAEEIAAPSRIQSVALFKNGLAVVRRTVDIAAPGTYRIDDVPTPVHGTFWIESALPVDVRVTSRQIEVPLQNKASFDFQNELADQQVTITFRDGSVPPVTGIVVAVAEAKGEQAWDRAYQQPRYGWQYGPAPMPDPNFPGRFLLLKTATGRAYVDTGMIAYVAAAGDRNTVKRRQPVLLLNVKGEKPQPGTITISYLTKGIAWAPSYRIAMLDDKKLSLEQQAVVKNELTDLSDVEIGLISGFPSVQFGHVISPLSPRTNWANFFAQLNQEISPSRALAGNAMQQVALNAPPADTAPDLSATPEGEGVDLHYQSIGKQTLTEGDSLSLGVAKGECDYERLVEWIVPDTRTPTGQFINDYERDRNPDKYQDAAWDAIRFKNPLPFAMTTGPIMVVANGRFNGQRLSNWVNAGEQTTVQITKAMSLRTRAVEQEEPNPTRETVYLGGASYRKVRVKGELTVNNHRNQPLTLLIRRQFSGELLQADANPAVFLREEGVYSVNHRNELTWTLKLKPGEERILSYRYEVLVHE